MYSLVNNWAPIRSHTLLLQLLSWPIQSSQGGQGLLHTQQFPSGNAHTKRRKDSFLRKVTKKQASKMAALHIAADASNTTRCVYAYIVTTPFRFCYFVLCIVFISAPHFSELSQKWKNLPGTNVVFLIFTTFLDKINIDFFFYYLKSILI